MPHRHRLVAAIYLLLICSTLLPATHINQHPRANSHFSIQAATPSFNLTVNPINQRVQVGGRVDYAISLTSLNNFQGQITLQTKNFPTELTGAFNPTTLNLTPDSTANSTLTVYAIAGGFQDYYEFQIQALSGSQTQTVNLSISIAQESSPLTPASYAFLAAILLFAAFIIWYGIRSRRLPPTETPPESVPKPPPV